LQAEILDLKANPDARAQGLVIESRLDIGLGPVATLLVQRGTLEVGQYLVIGAHYGRVRKMLNDRGVNIDSAPPSTPVQITGMSGVPDAGEIAFVVEDEKTAREIVANVERQKREAELASRARKNPADFWDTVRKAKELKVIVKGDVQGSVEAVCGSIIKIGNDEVKVRLIHSGVGGITENDVNLATSSEDNVAIVGFNVRPEARAAAMAEERGIPFMLHSIIYDIEDAIKRALEGMLSPVIKEHTLGKAEVREIFNAPKIGVIAGCFVQEGSIKRNAKCRVVRDSVVVYESLVASLKRFKDDAREVKSGFECGLTVHNYNDIKPGDVIEAYELQQERATL
jgi:translation initiation factor IF-2